MSKKMLIDATHHEETRVAIVEDNRLEEFDYESTFRKPLKGNIFLAKVTRVEPSLQAAFVNFGGNRHGFLPFSEIHPDYFRIPIADREALMAEQEAALKEMEEAEEAEAHDDQAMDDLDDVNDDAADSDIAITEEDEPGEPSDELPEPGNEAIEGEDDPDGNTAQDTNGQDEDGNRRGGRDNRRGGRGRGRGGRGRNAGHRSRKTETYENMDEEQKFRFRMRRKYKIQEVVKRGQIMLIQVSKEERGNKGAAVGSYLSLPGRYCVLMPNSPRAGGVSRKISNYKDRAKMRELLKDLEVPKGMSVILRTAGVTRTKAEVKRDLEYLLRVWSNIVELTKESYAPAMVYEEANLVKRAVRDLYTRDVEEIIVSGEEGYKTSKEFMKMMIPSHVKKVKEFKDDKASLFQKHDIERQIAEIGETTVELRSGGYLVINPTEALVSVDVNSGKATKERHIEETAVKTNLEAAEEVARQLRLRDLGGLVVIDFIDMEDRRNNAKVERKMRDSLSGDRARIQVGRISNFGLMEMSRQRLNPSLSESQFETCPHCAGTGRTRTADAASIMLLRAIEEEAVKGRAAQIIVHVSRAVALYLLNQKRDNLSEIESRYGLGVLIRVDDEMGAAGFRVEVSKPAVKDDGDDSTTSTQKSTTDDSDQKNEGRGRRRGRRGGRRRGGHRDQDDMQNTDQNTKSDDTGSDDSKAEASVDSTDTNAQEEKPKRVRKKKDSDDSTDTKTSDKDDGADKKKTTKSRSKSDAASSDTTKKQAPSNDDDAPKDEKPLSKAKPKAAAKPKAKPKATAKKEEVAPKDYETVNEAPKAKKKGWWSKGSD